jgi:steroid 5-alpha reductase family enzyme
LISPLFVIFLLTRVSGVPILEARADEKWGGQEDYEAYKESTSVLVPMPPSKPA